MSKINALRIVNLNYNNNAIHVDDETFRFDGESTLMALRNGGGKSVIVQMMIAPFVRKSYRNTKDRPFASFFTTNKPSFILVEWALDGNAGYVLTGMMVRKALSGGDGTEQEELEIINFICEYKSKCKYDINNLPVVENSGKDKILKGFGYCKQLFETLKKDSKGEFNYYDMGNIQQSRRYFERLKEFQIDSKEWETIIKKVNLKESGLSDLFSDAKDEKGLIEKWFIDTVGNKLNKEKNMIKEFESIVIKYIMQYKENQSKIERKAVISKFKEEAVEIQNKALEYKNAWDEQVNFENRIANLISVYHQLKDNSDFDKLELEDSIAELDKIIARIEYEEISYEIYKKEDEKERFIIDYNRLDKEWDLAKEEGKTIKRKLNIIECAKYYEDYKEASREQQLCENRIEIAKSERSQLEPERNKIGFNLKVRYESQRDYIIAVIKNLENQITQDKEEEYKLKVLKSQCEKEKEISNVEYGRIRSEISSYDQDEENYNKRFKDNLLRNILGEYEPATLELKTKLYDSNLNNHKRQLIKAQKSKEELEEEIKVLSRNLEDTQKEDTVCGTEIDRLNLELNAYEEEIDARKVILKYLGLHEDDLFQKERIIDAFYMKIKEVEEGRRKLEKEYDKIEKECNRLKQGTVLELPKDFELFLDTLDIHHIYGMEWLKKNGMTLLQNKKLVENNPFIPYSIILSSSDLTKLQKDDSGLYTSFPIPIIKREDLEKIYDEKNVNLEQMKKVNFFVVFNYNLLDPVQLANLIRNKEDELIKKGEQISVRKEEYNSYIEKMEQIKNQKVNKDIFEKTCKELKTAIKRKQELEVRIDELKDQNVNTKVGYESLIEEINKQGINIQNITEQSRELLKLSDKYKRYIYNRESLAKLNLKLEELTKTINDTSLRQEQLVIQISETNEERLKKTQILNETNKKVDQYFHYGHGEISNKDTEDLEARYKAITEGASSNQQLLEDNLKNAKFRYSKSEKQLISKADKYALNEIEYQSVIYDEFIEQRIEEELKQKNTDIQELTDKINKSDKEIAILERDINSDYSKMQENCYKNEPVSRSEIINLEFKKNIIEKKEEKNQTNQKLEMMMSKIANLDNSLYVLSEYEDFIITKELEFTERFNEMSMKELKEYNGSLLRDYKQSVKEKGDNQGKLRDRLNEVARIEEFADEFYMKPIAMLISLLDDAKGLLEQLKTILGSYDMMMEKLETDIAFIGKEKEKVNELLLDYILQIHNELGKIDKNSTINIRGKSIKMLKLILPIWNDHELQYGVRVKDFMEELTTQALIAIDNNENIEELIGKRITTKNIYNEVVGIANIMIKLYKVEEQREYPITWAEVSKNSGGEGFLSAFVILSSLLYYMRRDDTDLFAQKEEGKVLVMDNPFAQTNSSHLLKPLMDIARKTNTQLICLSGLGGDSIYNCFDNIYVMNLVSSNLRKGMQYMKTEHIKGVEVESEEMVVARVMIEDDSKGYYEQESLF